MKKVIVIVTAYALLAFAAIYFFLVSFSELPVLLEGRQSTYRILEAGIMFCKFLPALLTSAFLIACATAFAKDAQKAVLPYSPVVIAHFKKVFSAGLVMTFLIFAGFELYCPYAAVKMEQFRKEPVLLAEYMALGNKAYDAKNYFLAYEYGKQAQFISPEDKDVLVLVDKAEALKDVQRTMLHAKPVVSVYAVYRERETKGMTVTELIAKAKEAWDMERWFDCHYWAELAVSVSDSKDVNVNDAKRMAADSWKKLNGPSPYKADADNEIFSAKREAYASLNAGNVLDAYYKYLAIQKRLNGVPDPDVSKFLDVAKDRVVQQCFFIDETENLDKFESYNNVYFSITHSDGSKEVVYIRGVTPVNGTGGMIQYLRGISVTKFDLDGKIEKTMFVPYVKMHAEKTEVFSEEDKERFDIKDEFKTVPVMMLNSVDRYTRDVVCNPEYQGATAEEMTRSFDVFAMPYEYFDIICEAGRGSYVMTLPSLYSFVPVADDYGYSSEVYGAAFMNRLCLPFALFFFLLFASLMAWNYRISESQQFFKFRWVLIFPLSSTVFFFVIEFLLSVLNLFNFAVFGFSGSWSVLIALGVSFVLLFWVSVSFVKRTSE